MGAGAISSELSGEPGRSLLGRCDSAKPLARVTSWPLVLGSVCAWAGGERWPVASPPRTLKSQQQICNDVQCYQCCAKPLRQEVLNGETCASNASCGWGGQHTCRAVGVLGGLLAARCGAALAAGVLLAATARLILFTAALLVGPACHLATAPPLTGRLLVSTCRCQARSWEPVTPCQARLHHQWSQQWRTGQAEC